MILRHASAELLSSDFEANLRKGRAFVPGSHGLAQRDLCQLRIEHPDSGRAFCVRAEAVWIDAGPPGGTGLSFLDFDAAAQDALRSFATTPSAPSVAPRAPSVAPRAPSASSASSALRAAVRVTSPGRYSSRPPTSSSADDSSNTPISSRVTVRAAGSSAELAAVDVDPSSDPESDVVTPAARHLHDRVRELDLSEREVMARQGSMPERVALERRFGSSVWEGLLHNPQITTREVLRMAKSTSLPTGLVNLIVANRAWLSDGAINQALLSNPRVSGTHLERVLRALPQADIQRVAEQSSLRMQVRQAAKRLIRR
ncbi:MAG TPA: hypothetical protein VMG12_01645 [Polyangiaceae bacterium]|nr:hypothetical protein [Polyangiaceae bacterium]